MNNADKMTLDHINELRQELKTYAYTQMPTPDHVFVVQIRFPDHLMRKWNNAVESVKHVRAFPKFHICSEDGHGLITSQNYHQRMCVFCLKKAADIRLGTEKVNEYVKKERVKL